MHGLKEPLRAPIKKPQMQSWSIVDIWDAAKLGMQENALSTLYSTALCIVSYHCTVHLHVCNLTAMQSTIDTWDLTACACSWDWFLKTDVGGCTLGCASIWIVNKVDCKQTLCKVTSASFLHKCPANFWVEESKEIAMIMSFAMHLWSTMDW